MVDIYSPSPDDHLSLDELELYKLMMDYRASLGLPDIPLSKSLTLVAGRHVLDTVENSKGYVGHNWSDAPYDSADSSTYPNMWDAPQRLGTPYTGSGFEISTGYLGNAINLYDVTPQSALTNWQNSAPHNDVITNGGPWTTPWMAIGVGMKDGVAHVWFGWDTDPGVPQIKGTNGKDKIVTTRFDDNIKAGKGDDVVKALGGDDSLRGMGGDDKMNGGPGADLLIGGGGDDTMTGGGGPDRFVFNNRSGDDVVRGFKNGDVLDLRKTDADDFGDLAMSRQGDHTLIEFGNASVLIVRTAPQDLDASDFLF
ncbi:CAP domain-containing protein [Acuticoccus kandeliae]|uniref:CAP domain-containing protein n=1 Tax=Acuticoccus kandeliae TaxID=2073160 RepID=UPI000D3E84BA|nr:CAP domain-containing protein [Acuticoccus kandeliae]